MKFAFAALLPWMAVSAAGFDVPLPATLTLASAPIALDAPAVRLGDELFVPAKMAPKLGWDAKVQGSTAIVQVNGRPVTTFVRKLSGEKYLPVRTILASVGGLTEWAAPQALKAYSRITRITTSKGELQVNGTLPMNRKVFLLENPPRIVMDLYPAKVDSNSAPAVSGNVRYSQFESETVRVVAQLPSVPKLGKESGNSLSPKAVWDGTVAVAPTIATVKTFNILGAVIEIDTDDEAIIRLPVSAALTGTATSFRDRDGSFVVNLPGATLPENANLDLSGRLIQKGEFESRSGSVRLRLQLKKPMGIKVKSNSDEIIVSLSKPTGSGPLRDRIIIIDPGHGGTDSGAHFESETEGNLAEKEVTLAVSQMVSEMLGDLGANSILTRSDDLYIGLKERPAIADNTGGHLFVSIHVNSNQVSNSRSGPTTYYHADNADAKLLAECIQAELAKVSGLPDNGVRSDTTVYDVGFAVLRHAKVPAVLVELAYINHDGDRQLLRTDEFRRKLAAAIVQGIKVYLGDAKKEKTN